MFEQGRERACRGVRNKGGWRETTLKEGGEKGGVSKSLCYQGLPRVDSWNKEAKLCRFKMHKHHVVHL